MTQIRWWVLRFSLRGAGLAALLALNGCHWDVDNDDDSGRPVSDYSIGGTVAGLNSGQVVVLSDNGSSAATVSANGRFTFPNSVHSGATYSIAVSTNPIGQTCAVSNGAGTAMSAVANITITCSSNSYAIGGAVAGLTPGQSVTIVVNGVDPLRISANGSFVFPSKLSFAAPYVVTVGSQPPTQSCSVGNPEGTVPAAAVTNLSITCTNDTYTVGGTVSGLNSGQNLVLNDNGQDALTVGSNGRFTFPKALISGSAFAITVANSPNYQTCAVASGSGSIAAANITSIAVTCTNNPSFVYVISQTANNVAAYSINASSGALTPVPGSPFAAGTAPFGLTVNAAGTFAYVANHGSNNVSVFAIGPTTGALTEIAGSPFPAGANPFSVTLNTAGTFAYVANYGDSTVSGYSIDPATGALTPMAGSPFAAGLNPISATVNPAGTVAYVANYGSGANDVSAYSIDPVTGSLTPLAASPFAAGSRPFWVTTNPAGTYAYIANYGSGNVSGYNIDAVSGALTPIAGSPFAGGPTTIDVSVNPAGTFAYAVNAGGTISAYAIDPATGALTQVAGSPFAAGPGAFSWCVAISPAGTFAYVTNYYNNSISAYSIDANTGALTPIAGSPFAAQTNPYVLVAFQPK